MMQRKRSVTLSALIPINQIQPTKRKRSSFLSLYLYHTTPQFHTHTKTIKHKPKQHYSLYIYFSLPFTIFILFPSIFFFFSSFISLPLLSSISLIYFLFSTSLLYLYLSSLLYTFFYFLILHLYFYLSLPFILSLSSLRFSGHLAIAAIHLAVRVQSDSHTPLLRLIESVNTSAISQARGAITIRLDGVFRSRQNARRFPGSSNSFTPRERQRGVAQPDGSE